MSTATAQSSENEVTILARFLGDGNGQLPKDVARYILDLHVSERDKARMHDLAVRNQDDALTPCREGRDARLRQGDHPAFDPEIQSPPHARHQAQNPHRCS